MAETFGETTTLCGAKCEILWTLDYQREYDD